MVSGGSFFRLPNVKGLRRRKESGPVKDDPPVQVRLPQEILNQIIEEYHTSYPEQPLYPLLTSRSLYEAIIPCLYRSIAFTIKQETRDRWLSLLMSLRERGGLVRSLELTEPMGPNDQTELSSKDLGSIFVNCLAGLSQLRSLSIKCRGAKLPAEILVNACRLPHLRALELDNLSFIGANCDSLQFSAMEELREVRLTSVQEHDGCLKWSTFIPLTLNQSTRHFEYFTPPGSSKNADDYSFLQFLEGESLTFPEMRELRLPRPATAVAVDRGIDLLQRCPGLQVLGFESKGFNGRWGTQINDLGQKLPWDYLSQLRTINGPPELVSAVAPGRPIQRAMIRLDRQTELTLLSTLGAVRQSTVPLEGLAIWTYDWRDTSLQEIVDVFPQLQSLAICVLSVPALTAADWKLEALFALNRLEKLCLIGVDAQGAFTSTHPTIQRRVAVALFKAIPSLHTLWFHVLSDKWTREGVFNHSSSKTFGNRIRGLLGVPAAW